MTKQAELVDEEEVDSVPLPGPSARDELLRPDEQANLLDGDAFAKPGLYSLANHVSFSPELEWRILLFSNPIHRGYG